MAMRSGQTCSLGRQHSKQSAVAHRRVLHAAHTTRTSKMCQFWHRQTMRAAVLQNHDISGQAPVPQPKATEQWALIGRKKLAAGWLEFVRWENGSSGRLLRIWVPSGYYRDLSDGKLARADAPANGWPVLYLNDAQNLFEDSLSFSGRSWRAAETASRLIQEGDVPPFIIVGMDRPWCEPASLDSMDQNYLSQHVCQPPLIFSCRTSWAMQQSYHLPKRRAG